MFDAGEFGPIFSHKYSRSGNISESLVFSRIAGANAAMQKADATQDSVMNGKANFESVSTKAKHNLQPSEVLGVGRGISGEIAIAVKMDGDMISSVRVLSNHETPVIGSKSIQIRSQEAISNNGIVNDVSGATITSEGFKSALQNVLHKK